MQENRQAEALRMMADSMLRGFNLIGEQHFGTYFSDYDGELPRAACGIGCVILGNGNFKQYLLTGKIVRASLIFNHIDLGSLIVPMDAIKSAEIPDVLGFPDYPTVFGLVTYMNDRLKMPIPEIADKLRLVADALEEMEA